MWQHLSERVAEEREEGLAALVVRLWGRATTALTAHDRADGEETKEGEGGGSKEGEGGGGVAGEAVTRLPKGDLLSAVDAKGFRSLMSGGGAPEACHSALLSLLDVVQAGGGGGGRGLHGVCGGLWGSRCPCCCGATGGVCGRERETLQWRAFSRGGCPL